MMELLRADVDAVVLPWIAARGFRRADFPVVPSTGVVRLHPALAKAVAGIAVIAAPASLVDRAASWLADTVTHAAAGAAADG